MCETRKPRAGRCGGEVPARHQCARGAGKACARNAAFLKRLRGNEAKLAIASITLHEALYGVERLPDGKRKEGLREYMREVVMKMSALPYDAKAAEWHARERARLEAAGRKMPYADGQIAAVAVVNRLTVVTANVRDFRHVEGLRVESRWA